MNEISEVTRRDIVDFFEAEKVNWAGRMAESAFLARLYDMTALPSHDHRYRNAAQDIAQHRDNWSDWDDTWVFYDPRFNLAYAEDEELLRFLCETLHPVIRSDAEEARRLAAVYNRYLRPDGWELYERGSLSGKPIYASRRVGSRTEIFSEPTGWDKVDRQVQEVRTRLAAAHTEEQFQSVGLLCREVLISVAEACYDRERHLPNGGVEPSRTDAARMLEGYFATELQGGSNEEARAHAKAALKLAVALQHRRTADYRMAALCAEGTASVVNIVAVLSGRR